MNNEKKEKGVIRELAVAARLAREGWQVLFPFGENCRYDIVIERGGIFRRIQVKYSTPKNGALRVNCRSSNNWSVLPYTVDQIDYYAVYDPVHGEVYFISIKEVRNRSVMLLRVDAPKNNQHTKVWFANNYRLIT